MCVCLCRFGLYQCACMFVCLFIRGMSVNVCVRASMHAPVFVLVCVCVCVCVCVWVPIQSGLRIV